MKAGAADRPAVRLVVPGPPHLGVLAAVHAACFEPGWSAETFAELLAHAGSIAWLALVDDVPVGMVLARVTEGEGEILTLGLVPKARGRGIASLLLDRVLNATKSASGTLIFLEVAAINGPALRLYRRAGFCEIGRRRNYYRLADGRAEDAVVMRKDL
jgi:ribosomal-protein-alanine N-acetyltransferase